MRTGPVHPSRPRSPRAFFIQEALLSLAVVTLLAAVLAISLGQQRKSLRALADARAAARLAENRLLALQAGTTPETLPPEASLTLAPVPGGAPAPGQAWVEVTATFRGRKATLVGLVPAAALAEGPP